jgi:serine/threonine-protein kinase
VVAAVVNKSMNLEPEKRYQTPGQMHADLRQAADRLAAGEVEAYTGGEDSSAEPQNLSPAEQVRRQREAARYLPDSQRRALLVVESNSQLQDLFRDTLKRYGYRVLVISDPQRALTRAEDSANAVDGIVLSTGHLGDAAVDAFTELATGEQTSKLPVIVLLDDKHAKWRDRIKPNLSEHRVIVPLPIKLREFRDVLFRLVPPVATAEA